MMIIESDHTLTFRGETDGCRHTAITAPPLPSMLDVDLPEPVDLQAIRSSAHRGIPRQAHHGRGELKPDDVVVSVVANRIGESDTANGFIHR
jgi:hypothetical protein